MEDEAEAFDGSGFEGGKEVALELRMAMVELAVDITLMWSEVLLSLAEDMSAQIRPGVRKPLRRAA